jgi:hypothetical protein
MDLLATITNNIGCSLDIQDVAEFEAEVMAEEDNETAAKNAANKTKNSKNNCTYRK